MLNKNLAPSEIHSELKEFIDPAQLLVNDYNVEKEGPSALNGIPLQNSSEFLGIIHHALNIHKYQEPKFREKLIQTADESQLLKFFKEINLISNDKKKLTSTEIMELSKKASRLSWKDDEPTRAFVKIFGYDESLVPVKEDVKTVNEIVSTPKKDPKTGKITLILNDDKPLKELHQYQSKIFFQADELVENKFFKFMLTMPTGSGKTRTAMEIVTHFFNRNDNRQVLWLAGQRS